MTNIIKLSRNSKLSYNFIKMIFNDYALKREIRTKSLKIKKKPKSTAYVIS